MSESRSTAVLILEDILKRHIFFSEAKNRDSVAPQDAAFVNMLVLTTLRRLSVLKKELSRRMKKKLPEKVASAEYALYLAMAEILYMNTPEYAVLNSYVDLIKKQTDKYVAGFANAVLRKICAEKESILQNSGGEFFPQEFFRILNRDYNKRAVGKIREAVQHEPPLDITVKKDPERWVARLNGRLMPNGSIRTAAGGRISELPGYISGDWWVQDMAASLPVLALGDVKGLRVLDMCAAPGGKTAQLLNAGAEVTSLDISESRLKTLKDNIARLGLPMPEIICADGLDYLEKFRGVKYDAILLDAPCSATGTLRRHPEIMHIKCLRDIEKQALLQTELLNASVGALRQNGTLLYCVCSISKDEGEKQIREFLKTHRYFRPLPITERDINLFGTESLADLITPEGFLRTLPFHLASAGGMDSFFAAKLQKVA